MQDNDENGECKIMKDVLTFDVESLSRSNLPVNGSHMTNDRTKWVLSRTPEFPVKVTAGLDYLIVRDSTQHHSDTNAILSRTLKSPKFTV